MQPRQVPLFLFDSCPAAKIGALYQSTEVDTLAWSFLVQLLELIADLLDTIQVNAVIAFMLKFSRLILHITP